MTRRPGGPQDGNEWKKYRVVPSVHPSYALLHACVNMSGSKVILSFPVATWDRFRYTVEPSPNTLVTHSATNCNSIAAIPPIATRPKLLQKKNFFKDLFWHN